MLKRIVAAGAAAVSIIMGAGAPATAQVPAAAVPIEAYGKLPGLEQVVISPDGQKLAYVAVVGDARRLNVITLGGQGLAAIALGETKVRDVMWGDNEHVIITTSTTNRLCALCDRSENYVSQSYSITTRKLAVLLKDTDGAAGPFGMGSPYIKRVNGKDIVVVASFLNEDYDYRPVQFSVNLDTGVGSVFDFNFGVMDEDGYVVAAYQHFSESGGRWRLVTGAKTGVRELFVQNNVGLDAPELLGYGRTEGTVLLRVLEDDQWNYYEIDLTTGARKAFAVPAGARPFIDGKTDRFMGFAALTGDSFSYTFDDPAMAASWAKVANAFKGKNPHIVSWDRDYKKAIVRTIGAGETGAYYLMDFAANRATPIGVAYPAIKPEQVNETRYVTYKAADGMEIPAYLTLPRGRDPKNLPLIVLPHGGPQARDEPGFDWWTEALASRGYAVLRPQFRGSDGFGVAHTRAGFGQWGRKMQTDLSDGVRWLAADGVIDPKRVCIVGASYGGYAAMAGVSLDTGVYRCGVAVAGVSDMKRFLAFKKEETGAANSLGVRFWRRFLGVEKGGDAVLAQISPLQQVDRFYAPILLIHGKDDLVVPYDQSELLAKALARAGKPHEFVTLQGEDHWLSRSSTRLQMLNATVTFLEKHNPPA